MIVFDLHIRIKAKFFVVFQPFAWEAREYLRKKLIGKEVAFVIEYTVPGTGREYGCVYLGKGEFLFLSTKEHASNRNKQCKCLQIISVSFFVFTQPLKSDICMKITEDSYLTART